MTDQGDKSAGRSALLSVAKKTFAVGSVVSIIAGSVGFMSYNAVVSGVGVHQIAESQESADTGGVIGADNTAGVTRTITRTVPTATSESGAPTVPSPPVVEKQEIVTPGGENILVIGSDTRTGASGDIGAGGADAVDGARSDVNMLIHISEDKKRAKIISLPRDLDVNRPDCVSWDNDNAKYGSDTVSGKDHVKLNSAYAVGGPRCLSKVVSTVVTGDPAGLPINRFLAVDFAGFIDVINKMGGVEVCVTKPMQDRELGMILDRPGTFDLNGEKALDFARARKVMAESGSDYDRIFRQQYLIKQGLSKLISSGAIAKPEKMGDLIAAVSDNMYGQNISSDELTSLVVTFGKMGMGGLSFHTVPTSGTEGGNEVMDIAAAQDLFADISGIGAYPSVDHAPVSPPSGTGPAPREAEASLTPASQAQPLLC